MDIFGIELFALIGFILASYSIVANDAIQTLGTFLASNSKRAWVVLWLFASAIIVGVMLYGWFAYDGDIAFDRLNRIPYPENGIQWWHALPPLALLILTRFGIPVSTTFLVLTIFALTGGESTEGVMESMMIKSFIGYLVAFGAGILVWLLISNMFERWVWNTREKPHTAFWFAAQWLSTAFLWSQWLMQDLANIFVFLPRETTIDAAGEVHVTFSLGLLIFATALMLVLHAIIFATRGGEIQKIVTSKTNTRDIRAATVVDLIYGLILLFFKELNDVPMSTTWVFLGLLAGREAAISLVTALRKRLEMIWDVVSDVIRAFIGLVVSVILAIALPAMASGQAPSLPSFLTGAFQ